MTNTLGSEIDTLYKLKEKLEKANKEAAIAKEKFKGQELIVMEAMETNETTKGGGKLATTSISEVVVPHVEDWDRFYAYILRTKSTHLLQRRPAEAAYREALEIRKGRDIPGTSPFTKKRLSLTKVGS